MGTLNYRVGAHEKKRTFFVWNSCKNVLFYCMDLLSSSPLVCFKIIRYCKVYS